MSIYDASRISPKRAYWFIKVGKVARSVSFHKHGGKTTSRVIAEKLNARLQAENPTTGVGRPIGHRDARSSLSAVGVQPTYSYVGGQRGKQTGYRAKFRSEYADFRFRQYGDAAYSRALQWREAKATAYSK